MPQPRGLCIDISGVLHEDGEAVAGAREAVARVREASVSCRFLTNTSRKPSRAVLEQLRKLGFEATEEEVLTAPAAVARHLDARNLKPWLLVHPDIEVEFEPVPASDADAVVVCDAGERFDYRRLDEAFGLLMEGAPLLAVGMNRYFSKSDGLHLDAGPFIRALEYAAGIEATIIGKPGKAMFHEACDSMGLAPGDCLMVGDDVEADIGGAREAGLEAALVRTGKYQEADRDRAGELGAGVFDDISAVVSHWFSDEEKERPGWH
ncbi:TIGR01458 family HAD-type hydrolase [Marinobacter sp. TBZ242]|uniref:Haloacid dehalogenase-like hydrolase domain-containing protein 2 n=1 Tax=Marinobacter azerbaijanicus TaxID=3050455 RepID=A0ABT7IHI9_9GAMM|nr:TIGR01458 family HAD-type hydrolase [Marinobacter sp. TBZ242]MDL0433600.1 TIGR01458 family HAD-type hydrolase [Marinobacter sp. TBZ242]